jgi:hypothetical protein
MTEKTIESSFGTDLEGPDFPTGRVAQLLLVPVAPESSTICSAKAGMVSYIAKPVG